MEEKARGDVSITLTNEETGESETFILRPSLRAVAAIETRLNRSIYDFVNGATPKLTDCAVAFQCGVNAKFIKDKQPSKQITEEHAGELLFGNEKETWMGQLFAFLVNCISSQSRRKMEDEAVKNA